MQRVINATQGNNSGGSFVFAGSGVSELRQLFRLDQPLYGAATRDIKVMPWLPSTVQEIVKKSLRRDPHLGENEDECLLANWSMFGGIPLYYETQWNYGGATKTAVMTAIHRYIVDHYFDGLYLDHDMDQLCAYMTTEHLQLLEGMAELGTSVHDSHEISQVRENIRILSQY